MVVLIGSIIGFSISYMIIETDDDREGFIASLLFNYRTTFGDFDTDVYSNNSQWILFLIASIFLPLIMMNLLIAIMSDTYARVMADIVPSDY